MEVTVKAITENQEVLNSCRVTVWKDNLEKEPSEKFMYDIYFSEHSPIRDKVFVIDVVGVKSWVITHFVRHHEGFTPYISSQRDDRHASEVPRDELPQGALVNCRITLNAQAFINVSRKRFCLQAHKEAREFWSRVIEALTKVDPILANQCVPNCIYRGGICPEGKNGCGYNISEPFILRLKEYIGSHEKAYREIK